jgi:hypothetical protein
VVAGAVISRVAPLFDGPGLVGASSHLITVGTA